MHQLELHCDNAEVVLSNLGASDIRASQLLFAVWPIAYPYHFYSDETEPLELNGNLMFESFDWCDSFGKIKASRTKTGALAKIDEVFVLWSNF